MYLQFKKWIGIKNKNYKEFWLVRNKLSNLILYYFGIILEAYLGPHLFNVVIFTYESNYKI